jgi:hypothetical protein
MTTLDLEQAAAFLQMNPRVLSRKAAKGLIPGAKPGKRWVFVKEHLADWISGRYPASGNPPAVGQTSEKTLCQFTNAAKRGGSTSRIGTETEYDDLLKPRTSGKPKSSTTG